MPDIQTRQDVETFVNSFYKKVLEDELLAPVFAPFDMPAHLPVMYSFWASMLLGEQSYKGNPFQKHLGLFINTEHFNRWLALFDETIDEHFEGTKATETKERAQHIARLFQFKLGLSA